MPELLIALYCDLAFSLEELKLWAIHLPMRSFRAVYVYVFSTSVSGCEELQLQNMIFEVDGKFYDLFLALQNLPIGVSIVPLS
ncbi:hypothetical protein AKJ16_DCAP20516 [Drosera capensis]